MRFLVFPRALLTDVFGHFGIWNKMLNFVAMSCKNISDITDPLEAIKSLFEEMTSVKAELSSCKSDVARLNRNNTKLNLTNRKVTQLVLVSPMPEVLLCVR